MLKEEGSIEVEKTGFDELRVMGGYEKVKANGMWTVGTVK